MRSRKVFVLFEDLCGEVANIAAKDKRSVYIDAALNSIDAVSSIFEYIQTRANNKSLISDSQRETVEQVETYEYENKIKLNELRGDFEKNKLVFQSGNAERAVVQETIVKVSGQLRQTIEYVKKKKEVLSQTEELARENKDIISKMDEWLRTSVKNHSKLIKIYQGG